MLVNRAKAHSDIICRYVLGYTSSKCKNQPKPNQKPSLFNFNELGHRLIGSKNFLQLNRLEKLKILVDD